MRLPEQHQQFVNKTIETLQRDRRFQGLAIGGSALYDQVDTYSDLDLIVIANTDTYDEVLADRLAIAERLGTLLNAFTGEHVGEPRLLICLYDVPLLHVDLKFTKLDAFKRDRVENPVVLWERTRAITDAIRDNPASYPPVDPQWIEDRFWIWVHYGATKLGRGEYLEAIEMLSFWRVYALGPLGKAQAGKLPRGVRFLEAEQPEFATQLGETLPREASLAEVGRAMQAAISIYRQLRDKADIPVIRFKTEHAATAYLKDQLNAPTSTLGKTT